MKLALNVIFKDYSEQKPVQRGVLMAA